MRKHENAQLEHMFKITIQEISKQTIAMKPST